MPRPLRVALCQLASVHGDVQTNLDRMIRFVEEGGAQNADLIVFPEFALTGLAVAESPDLAAETEKDIDQLCKVAERCSIDIVGGFVERRRSHARDDALINVAYYIDKRGHVLSRYVKKNLWHPERDYLEPGKEERLTFQTDKFVAGLLVCWDLAWPEAARTLMGAGAEVLIVPTCWVLDDVGELGKKHDPTGANEMAWIDAMALSRAYENECALIFVNAGGSKEDGFLGHSAITMPFKGVVKRFDEPDERMEVVEIDLDVLADARATYKIHDDYAARQNDRKQLRQSTLSQ